MAENFHHELKCSLCGRRGVLQSDDPTRNGLCDKCGPLPVFSTEQPDSFFHQFAPFDEEWIANLEEDLAYYQKHGESVNVPVRQKVLRWMLDEIKRLQEVAKG